MRNTTLLALAVFGVLAARPAECFRGPGRNTSGLIRPLRETNEELAQHVRAAEIAFAKTMAARDSVSFISHVANEALFFGNQGVLRGKTAVAAGWKPFFEGAKAPFSWEPESVEVLDSGRLALSTGPVRNPAGRQIGTFNSIWRHEVDGRWKIVFDKGCPPCDSPPKR